MAIFEMTLDVIDENEAMKKFRSQGARVTRTRRPGTLVLNGTKTVLLSIAREHYDQESKEFIEQQVTRRPGY